MVRLGMLLLSFSLFAAPKNLYLGEKDFQLFYGPSNPLISEIGVGRRLNLVEKDEFRFYLDSFISSDMAIFQRYFERDLYNSLLCSHENLSTQYSYFLYIHRLIALSYLFEAIEQYDLSLKKMGRRGCGISWKKILNSCDAKTGDMKIFIKNVLAYVPLMERSVVEADFSTKEYLRKLRSSFLKNEKREIGHYRFRYTKGKKLTDLYQKACKEEASLFVEVCSERDRSFGMSYINESYPLIVRSNLFNIFDDKRVAQGCLRSFKRITKESEKRYKNLEAIFPYLYQRMSSSYRYAQGRIFPLGALREFRDKGIETVFLKPKVEKKLVVRKKKRVKLQHRVKTLKKKTIAKIIKKEKRKLPLEKKIQQKKKTESYFFSSYKSFLKASSTQFFLDMDEFRYDFTFTLNLKKALDLSLKPYLSRSIILKMRKEDKLGQKEGAIPLVLVKYMIETDKHQELFRLINIIGNKFYIYNDIDEGKDKTPIKITLENSDKTNYKWLISFVR